MTQYYKKNKTALPITVVILTFNEEEVIEGAINSAIQNFQEVVVLDSFSTDKTPEIIKKYNVRFEQNKFEGYASQRNHALKNIDLTTEWVFFLDADERITPGLVEELKNIFSSDLQHIGMMCLRRKDFFEGKWLRRSSGYPTWFGRVCNIYDVEIKREINEVYNCNKKVMKLESHILHFPFSKGISHWTNRHNNYSTLEAALMMKKKLKFRSLISKNIISRDPVLRRSALKDIYMMLPFRPLISFLYLFFFRGGIFDGSIGFKFAILRSYYEFLIDLKIRELTNKDLTSSLQNKKYEK